MGELAVFYRKGVLAAERHGGDGAGRRTGRVHGILLRREGNKESTIVGKLVAINFYHEQFLGLSVPMSNPLIRSVRQGIKRAHVGMGSQQKVRRPLMWRMLTEMQESVQAWGVGGRVLWIGLALTCFFMSRASELFASGKGVFHKVYCLRGGGCGILQG